jgi:hypothetical protein
MPPVSRKQAMTWFRTEFGAEINAAIKSTAFSLDLLTAIAYQETGYIFSRLLGKGMGRGDILRLCVGDTLDAPNRSAFPKTAAILKSWSPHGPAIFAVARQALVDMAPHVPGYSSSNPNKFCHGFGIFQYDIQFCKVDPQYFVDRSWQQFSNALAKAVSELHAAQGRVPSLRGKSSLTEIEQIQVAIAYNRGTYNPDKGLKQGHRDSSGKYYGEYIFDYLQEAKTLPLPPKASGPRLILAKHPDSAASSWVYQEMRTATFAANRYSVDQAELLRFLGLPEVGGVGFVADILRGNNLQYTVSDAHKSDSLNPRVYVFVGLAGEI